MPICKHCSHEATLLATAGATCPVCGFAYEFDASDWEFEDVVEPAEPGSRTEPLERRRESDFDATLLPGEELEGGTNPEVDFEADPTLAFGGRAPSGEEDEAEDDFFALGDGFDEQNEQDVTQAYIDLSGGTSPPIGAIDDDLPNLPAAMDDKRGTQGDSSREDATLPRGLSGSDSAGGSSVSDTFGTRQDGSGDLQDSGTIDIRGGSSGGRSSYGVPTPESRDIVGWDTGATTPRGALGDNHASQSLRASDTWQPRHENVRLRERKIAYSPPGDKAEYEAIGNPFTGGMGEVFRMRQKAMDRYVALKRPKKGKKSSEKERDGLVSEAVITGQLEHPNIVPVHDIGFDSEGTPFYTMKWVEGEEWEEALRRKGLTELENVDILMKVALAIAYAHSRNIIHRDLKPGNIWLGKFGEVLVMDWGLAARLDSSEVIVPSGTPIYMPPETALAYLEHSKSSIYGTDSTVEKQRLVPPGTYGDIYLLGALLFKIVTGKAPHKGKNTFDCLKNAARNRIRSTKKRGELLSIAYQAMATNPSDRQRDVGEFIDQLKSYQSHAQSVAITQRATTELEVAKEALANGSAPAKVVYANLARALHGFENALDLWPGNSRASHRLQETKQLYAKCALDNGDYDLATSMLDAEHGESAPLLNQVQTRQSLRNRRLRLYRTLQYAVAGSLAASLLFIGVSVFLGLDAVNRRKEIVGLEKSQINLQQELASIDTSKKELESQQVVLEEELGDLGNEKTALLAEQASIKEEAKRLTADKAKLSTENVHLQQERKEILEASILAQKSAKLANYEATLGDIRSALAEKGEYAARELFDAAIENKTIEKEYLTSAEWNALDRLTDWRKDAEPLAEDNTPTTVAKATDGTGVAIARVVPGRGTMIEVFTDENNESPQFELVVEGNPDQLALGKQSVATLNKGRLQIYDLASAKALKMPPSASSGFTAMHFHPTKPELFTGSANTGLAIWKVDSAKGEAIPTSLGDDLHGEPIASVGYSSDGELRFSADQGGHVRVWSTDRIQPWNYSHSVASLDGSIRLTAAVITNRAEGGKLIYGSRGGAVYDVSGGWGQPWSGEKVVRESAGGGVLLNDDPLDQQFVSTQEGSIEFANAPKWERTRPNKIATFPEGRSVEALCVGKPDGVHLVLVGAGGNRIMVHPFDGLDLPNLKYWRTYHDSPISSCAMWGDRGYSTDESGRAVKWEWKVDNQQLTYKPLKGYSVGSVSDIHFDADANSLAVAETTGFVRHYSNIRDANDQQLLVAGHTSHEMFRAWELPGLPNRRLTTAADHRACLWDTAQGTLLRNYDLGEREITAVSPDGKSLVAATSQGQAGFRQTGSGDTVAGAVAINLETGDERSLWPVGPRVTALCWLPTEDADNVQLAVGLRDGQVYIWSVKEGRKNLAAPSVRIHQLPITTLAYDANQNAIYSGDYEGVLARWDLADSPTPPQHAVLQRMPVRRIESSNEHLLALQQRGDQIALSLHDAPTLKELTLTHDPPKLLDATLTKEGGCIVGLDRAGNLFHCEPTNGQWQSHSMNAKHSTALQRWPHRLAELSDGQLLCYGRGLSFRVANWDQSPRLTQFIQSRPEVSLIATHGTSNLSSFAKDGRMTTFATSSNPRFESEQRFAERASAGKMCNGAATGQIVISSQSGDDLVIRRWDKNQAIAPTQIGRVDNSACEAISANHENVVLVVKQGTNRSILLIKESTGTIETVCDGIPAPARSVSIDLKSNRVAVVLNDGRVWVAARDNQEKWKVLPVESEGIASAIFTPDGERLLAGRSTGQIEFWELTSQNNRYAPKTKLILTGHSDPVQVMRYVVSGERQWLATGDAVGTVMLSQLKAPDPVAAY